MTSKKRRQRGSRTHGGGTHKNRRGAGHRGGRGRAGRDKHEKALYPPRGKYGFKRPQKTQETVLTVTSDRASDAGKIRGLGYIGLPTASLLATRGFRVYGVDVNADVVATINEGAIHIVEPDLDVLVRSAVQRFRSRGFFRPRCRRRPANFSIPRASLRIRGA